MFKSLVLLAAVIAASESVCPIFENTADIDIFEFSRDWKIQYFGMNSSESHGLGCVHAEFHADHNSQAPVPARLRTHGVYLETGEAYGQRYDGVIPDLNKPGFWLLSDNGTSIEISVMYSDHRDFALVLECDSTESDDEVGEVEAYFMAKNYNAIPDDVFQTMVDVLEANGVSFENIFPVPSDAESCAPPEPVFSTTGVFEEEELLISL